MNVTPRRATPERREPLVNEQPRAWWARYFENLNMEDPTNWHTSPGISDSTLHRAFELVYQGSDPQMYLHLSRRQLDGARIFRIDEHPRYGRRMQAGEFFDWQSGKKETRSSPNSATVQARVRHDPVRVWAIKHGLSVSDRGRIPAAIREAYRAAHRP